MIIRLLRMNLHSFLVVVTAHRSAMITLGSVVIAAIRKAMLSADAMPTEVSVTSVSKFLNRTRFEGLLLLITTLNSQ